MIKSLLIVLFSSSVVFFSGCNPGGGGKSAPAKTQEELINDVKQASSAIDYTTTITPNNFTVIKSDLDYNEQKEIYDIGCVETGLSYGKSIHQMDNRFVPGLVFTNQSAYSEIGSTSKMSGISIDEEKITKVDATSFESEYNLLSFTAFGQFNRIEDVFTAKPHITKKTTITVEKTDTYEYVSTNDKIIRSNYTTQAKEYLANYFSSSPTKYLTCSIPYNKEGNTYTSKTDKISYELNGKIVTAYLKNSTTTGNVVCKQYTFNLSGNGSSIDLDTTKPDFIVDMGKGSSTTVEILSNEAVNKGFYKCGGVKLYSSEKTTLDEGKVISTNLDKMLGNPLR